uniref:Uncharacterized protein n=1 Tax=Ditylenchus dipsaci TaxID=166011 RepID=A0A915D196_9BILA
MNNDQQARDQNKASDRLTGTKNSSDAAEGGSSPSAETRSAPGDLANLPLSWQRKLDYLVNTRPGTSQETESESIGDPAP